MSGAAKAEALIRHYFAMCNAANRQGLIDCFTPGGTHYFPPGLPSAPWRGAEAVADGWVRCVQDLGSKWTIEKVLASADGQEAAIEWTHWKTARGEVLRGDEWYVFNDDVTLIVEIRAYYASPIDHAAPVNALHGFDYAARGYHLAPPLVPGRDA